MRRFRRSLQSSAPRRRSAARIRAALLTLLPGLLASSACGAGQTPPASIRAHDGPVVCLAFRPDGRAIATGTSPPQDATRPREAKLWRLPQGTEEASIPLPAGCGAMSFSPDGRQLAVGDQNGTVLVRDFASGNDRTLGSPGAAGVTAIAFSPDGAAVAAGRNDGTVSIIDRRRMVSRGTLGEFGKRGVIAAVNFAPDGHDVLVVSRDGWIARWDPTSLREKHAFRATGRPILGAALSPDGTLLLTAGSDGAVRLWSLPAGEERAAIPAHPRFVLATSFSPDGRTIASVGQEGVVRIWDAASRRALAAFPGGSSVYVIAYSPDGKKLASGDGTGTVWIREVPETK